MRDPAPAVFLPFTVTAADLGGAGEPGPGRHQHGPDRAAGPAAAAVLTAEVAGIAVQGSFSSCPHRVGMLAMFATRVDADDLLRKPISPSISA